MPRPSRGVVSLAGGPPAGLRNQLVNGGFQLAARRGVRRNRRARRRLAADPHRRLDHHAIPARRRLVGARAAGPVNVCERRQQRSDRAAGARVRRMAARPIGDPVRLDPRVGGRNQRVVRHRRLRSHDPAHGRLDPLRHDAHPADQHRAAPRQPAAQPLQRRDLRPVRRAAGARAGGDGLRGLAPGLDVLACRRLFRRYATAQFAADLDYDMRTTPTASGTGPYDGSAEL